ncbi:phospho-N-acetylmuramoyl-pentapeptide-transferase [Candidatus Peregrinibacteria bacterium]|nr:phospho-N-acetylmuramoyl-pentapeptide-transferase [Candidatus Peregrinibacteria bacterium]
MPKFSIDIATALRHFILIFGLTIGSFLTVALATRPYYKFLLKAGFRKRLREETADGKAAEIFRKLHKDKEGTPTMGGVLIWAIVAIVILLSPVVQRLGITRFSLFNRNETYLPLFTLIATGVLGLVDDWLNIKGIKEKGLRVKPKFLWLTLFGLLGGMWFHFKLGYDAIHIPGIGDFTIGAFYVILFAFIIVASANAVNITDGLDGLAGGLTIIAFLALGIISYLQGLVILTAFCALIVGATIAFVWFNIPPALFYMGDTGALALGATMGVIAMLTNSVLILPFIAFIFVIEALSSLIQLTWKKLFKRKLLLIAPLHHHLEERGWAEEKVVMRFWIAGAFMAALGVILEFLSLLSGA